MSQFEGVRAMSALWGGAVGISFTGAMQLVTADDAPGGAQPSRAVLLSRANARRSEGGLHGARSWAIAAQSSHIARLRQTDVTSPDPDVCFPDCFDSEGAILRGDPAGQNVPVSLECFLGPRPVRTTEADV